MICKEYAFENGGPVDVGRLKADLIESDDYSMAYQSLPILTVCTPELGQAMIDQIHSHYGWAGPLIKGQVKLGDSE